MLMMSLQQAAKAVDGQCVNGCAEFSSVAIDTRTLDEGALYIAICGENFDGHQFVAEAKLRGAMCVMVQTRQEIDLPQLIVEDCRVALGRLARAWRIQLALPVVGITGSNGKTSVKEITASILSQAGTVFATRGNLNNDFGVPLTLLSLRKEHDFAAVEMGANHQGEIAYLTQMSQPNVVLVNNAGCAHLEGFGSLQGVAQAKGEIYTGLTENGIAIINRDDEYADYWVTLCQGKEIVDFSLEGSANVTAQWQGDARGSQLSITTIHGDIECHLALPGKHNVQNALAATSIAIALNVPLPQIKAGLQAMSSVQGRLQRKPALNGGHLIDDTYNANPSSFSVAIALLASCNGKRILVMGDMAELGDDARQLHQQIGEQAKIAGLDKLYALGDLSKAAVDGFANDAHYFIEQQKMIDALKNELEEGTTLLIKGSRSMQMERVVNALTCGESH